MSSIPVINLEALTVGDVENIPAQQWEIVADEVRRALHNVGFMYLVNHGVPEEVIDAGFDISKQFFEKPVDTKSKYKKDISKSRNGWVIPGEELLHQDSTFEFRECFDMTTKDRIIPSEIPNFSAVVSSLELHCRKVIQILLKLLAISLKLNNTNYFLDLCQYLKSGGVGNECDFSMIYYPPISTDTKLPPNTVRCAEHTDYEIMTLLFQNKIGGLEIKTKEGKWIGIEPIPHAILINTGDLLEIWTNNYYKATLHRVVIPKTEEEQRKARYSLAYFIAPDDETLVTPLRSPVIDEYLNKEEITAEEIKGHTKAPISAYDHIMKRVYTAYGVEK